MKNDTELLVKELPSKSSAVDKENSEQESSSIDFSPIIERMDSLIEKYEETNEFFDSVSENQGNTISFDDEFLKLYKKNTDEIIKLLDSISGSSISISKQLDVSNTYLSSNMNLGIVGICGLGFLCGAILMSVFSRYLKH